MSVRRHQERSDDGSGSSAAAEVAFQWLEHSVGGGVILTRELRRCTVLSCTILIVRGIELEAQGAPTLRPATAGFGASVSHPLESGSCQC